MSGVPSRSDSQSPGFLPAHFARNKLLALAKRYQLLQFDSRKIDFGAILVYFYIKLTIMSRQSISFTKPNEEWLKAQVEAQEYSSKSELVNDLIRQARKQQAKIDWVAAKLERAEKSGFTKDSKEQILAESKKQMNE
jgi:antitoxin ParD1/3/4